MSREDDICWYHENLTREETEDLLLAEVMQDGTFLVRRSGSSSGDYVLSVLNNDSVTHFQIRRHGDDAFFSIVENTKVHGLESLIEHYQEQPDGIDGVCLTVPVKGDQPPHDTRRHGRTNLLHRATDCGNYKIVSELLKGVYRLDAKNQCGQTAVHIACIRGYDEILMKLISCGANVNSRDTAAYTPLHYACRSNFVNTVRLLVQEGKANIQARNTENGWVPLHEAASAGHQEVVQELLILKAPIKPRTKKNELPVDLARRNGHIDCVTILEQYNPPTPKTSASLWYHGTLDRHESEKDIKNYNNESGTFLVRYSIRNKAHVLTLINDGAFFHFIIRKQENYFFIDDGPYLDSLEHVVEYYSTIADGLPVTLYISVPPKPKPPVPECKTIPRQKKKIIIESGSSQSIRNDSVPSQFHNIKFSSNFDLNTNLLNNNYTADEKNDVVAERNEEIPSSRLTIVSLLGSGEFGSVYKGKYFQPNGKQIDVAIKTLHDEQMDSNRDSFLSEAKVMMNLHHPCIVKLIGLSSSLQMVQEFMSLDSMLNYIQRHKSTIKPDEEFILWATQITSGMLYLEEQRFVHRDLAARNILLASVNQAKISDFGLSRAVGGNEYYKAKTGGKWPIKWYAPESYNYGTFSHKSDVWSFGVTIWEMYSFGEHPYGDQKGSQVIERINRGERLEQPPSCPDHIYKIMLSCWQDSAENRPTFVELFSIFNKETHYMNMAEIINGRQNMV